MNSTKQETKVKVLVDRNTVNKLVLKNGLNQDIFLVHYLKVQKQQLGFGIYMLMHMILIVKQTR